MAVGMKESARDFNASHNAGGRLEFCMATETARTASRRLFASCCIIKKWSVTSLYFLSAVFICNSHHCSNPGVINEMGTGACEHEALAVHMQGRHS